MSFLERKLKTSTVISNVLFTRIFSDVGIGGLRGCNVCKRLLVARTDGVVFVVFSVVAQTKSCSLFLLYDEPGKPRRR